MAILAGLFGPSHSLSSHDNWLHRALGGGKTHSGASVSEHTALNISGVYRAVSVISDTIAQLPIHVWRRTDDGRQVVNDHPVATALRMRPNPHMTPFSQQQVCQSHGLLWGNGYAEIARNGRGQAAELWPLMADCTRPERRDDGSLVYRTIVDGESIPIPGRNVVHIRNLGHCGYIGHSPIWLHRQGLGLALAAEEFGGKFFGNDAKSGGFIEVPGTLPEGGAKNIQNSLSDSQGGLKNAHRVKILEAGMKFVQTTIPPDDAQFLSTREFQIAEIARMYGVPLVLMQSHEKTTSWGSGIEHLLIGFVTWTLTPWIVQWEQELNWKLFTEEERRDGLFVKFALQALLRGDMASRAGFYKTLREISALSPNEIRELEDLDPDPRLDVFHSPANWQEVGAPDPAAGDRESTQQLRRAMANALGPVDAG